MNQELIVIFQENVAGDQKEKLFGDISGKLFARESFISGLLGNRAFPPMCCQGTMDTVLFNYWLENFLLPALGEGFTVVIDKATFHKSTKTKSLIENLE